jgi:hypothetical protein
VVEEATRPKALVDISSQLIQVQADSFGHQLTSRPICVGVSTSVAKVLDLNLVFVQNRTVEAREQRSALRSARYRADGPAVVALAAEVLQRADALQLLGDGLIATVDQRAEGAKGTASACAAMLRQRGWDGDDLLADHLESLIGAEPALTLMPLAVDLEELANILEGDPVYGGGRIDRRTGEVWPQPAIDYAVELGDEGESESESSERWLRVACLGSVESYRDMEFFIGALDDTSKANRRAAAIDGRGAFRRFRDALGAWPEELDRWYAISEERQWGRARAWLAERGYCVCPTPES